MLILKGLKYVLPLVLSLSLLSPVIASAVAVDDKGTTEHEVNQGSIKKGGKVDGKATAKLFLLKKGEYVFGEDMTLIDYKGKKHKDKFKDILSGMQERTSKIVKDGAKEDFSNTKIDLSMASKYDDGEYTFYYEKEDFFYNFDGLRVMRYRGKSGETKVVIPRGVESSTGKQINGIHVANFLKGLNAYKYGLKESVLAGTLGVSFNLLSMYPSRQMPLVDILKDEVDKKGVKTGKRVFKKGSVTMNYSLNKFSNPLFGNIDGSKVPESSDKYWKKKIGEMKLDGKEDTAKDIKIKLKVKDSYLKVLKGQTSGDTTFQDIPAKDIESTNSISSFKTTYSKKQYDTLNRIDMGFPLMIPKVFTLDIDNNSSKVYKLGSDGGFKVDTKTKFLLATDSVYVEDEEGKSKRVGDYDAYGVAPKNLVMASTRIDSKGNYSKKGKRVGAIVPQSFREMLIDIKGGSELYWTGRVAKFSNDYSGKITLDKENRDLLAIDTKTQGKMGVKLRHYAFPLKGDKKQQDSHKNIGKSPKQFSVQIAFHNRDGVKGFYIYRNNFYAEDKDLVKWLKSDEAKAMTDVKAEALLKVITGEMDKLTKKKLSYEEWQRMQEIKTELDTPLKTTLIYYSKLFAIIFGLFLISYSVLLLLAYFFDIVNVFMETSVLNLLTFGKLYPIDSDLNVDHNLGGEDVKYVNKWYVIILSIVTIAVGLLFIFITPLVELATYLFYFFSDLLGGV